MQEARPVRANMEINSHEETLLRMFETQRRAHEADPVVPARVRVDRLQRLIGMIEAQESRLIDAVNSDFGARSRTESMFAEIVASLSSARLAKSGVGKWMKVRRVHTPIFMRPGRSEIRPQPLGVAGVISPWNYPLYLALSPLASALAAGNRVLIKPSELTPHTSEVMKAVLGEVFDQSEVAVVTGGADIAAAFASLPFDHLLFTGSTAVGRKVARAAAENLTPVTLELGGKSPAIIDASADLPKAARSVVFGKAFNAGQTCVAPDYVIVTAEQRDYAIGALGEAFNEMYPAIDETPDYTSIISERHFDRLRGLVDESRAAGAQIVEFGNGDKLRALRKLPFTLIIDPPRDSLVMQEEIFGPVLPVISVPDAQAATTYVNQGARPLALYWFGTDRRERDRVLAQTVSGGVTVNDTNWHVVQENLPFGGVGDSGYGVYHGKAGFDTFSQLKPVFLQSRFANTRMMQPPYTASTERLLRFAKKYM